LATIWDYECVAKMLDALQDPVPQVRGTAAKSVAKLIQFMSHFDANASTDERAAAAKELRSKWEEFVTKYLKSWQRRLEKKDEKHEARP